MPPTVPSTEARYRLGRLLGEGATGEVWLARDVHLERDVALKLLKVPRPSLAARMLQEARITAGMRHPGLVPIHEVGTWEDGRLFFSMGLVQGRSLEELVVAQRTGVEPQDLGLFIDIFERVCETVSYAHDARVVHRDLKPANIMVGHHGEVYVVDWGLAGSGDARADGCGTPGYMAPEQAEPGRRLGPAADTYALGATLDTLLAAHPDGRQAAYAPLHALTERCLAHQEAARPADAGRVLEAVRQWRRRRHVDALLRVVRLNRQEMQTTLDSLEGAPDLQVLGWLQDAVERARAMLADGAGDPAAVEELHALGGVAVQVAVARGDLPGAQAALAAMSAPSEDTRAAVEALERAQAEQQRLVALARDHADTRIGMAAARHFVAPLAFVAVLMAGGAVFHGAMGEQHHEQGLLIGVAALVAYGAKMWAERHRPLTELERRAVWLPMHMTVLILVQRVAGLLWRVPLAEQVVIELWLMTAFAVARPMLPGSRVVVAGGVLCASMAPWVDDRLQVYNAFIGWCVVSVVVASWRRRDDEALRSPPE